MQVPSWAVAAVVSAIALASLAVSWLLNENAAERITLPQPSFTPSPGSSNLQAAGTYDTGTREYLHPFYVSCIHLPTLTQQGVTGGCESIHRKSNCDYKNALEGFRTAESITVDASQCARYLTPSPGEAGYVELKPVELALRPKSTDHDVFLQVYCGADFRFITVLSQFMPRGRPPVILDAGANIGAATVLFAHMAALSARIFSVEAFPANIEVLKGNVAPLGDIVTVVPRAIVAHDLAKSGHVLNFTGDSNQYWGFRVDHSNTWDAPTRVTQQVQSTSLPMLREEAGAPLDFVKLDIEGEEKNILVDPPSIEVLCEAACIFMELHDRLEPGCTAAFDEFLTGGCASGERFEQVAETGEYIIVCRVGEAVPKMGAALPRGAAEPSAGAR